MLLANYLSISTMSRDQLRRKIVLLLGINRLGVGRQKYLANTEAAFRARPKIKDALLIHVLGPFGSNQRISTFGADLSAVGVMRQFVR
jgi:hypothetical protein